MISIFAEPAREEIRQIIEQKLVSTFEVMFDLPVVINPALPLEKSGSLISSFIEMQNGNDILYLTLAAPISVASMICDRFEPGVKQHSDELLADIISEITNIVSCQLRTDIDNKYNIMFKNSTPTTGRVPANSRSAIKVFFTINNDHKFKMDMTCAGDGTLRTHAD